uniref:Biorientation of chromosomes in cell division 1 like 1 n=1 Tax=Ictidomys tridecemlineatus TaxID=43179 RepID=I3MTY3_ICTTR
MRQRVDNFVANHLATHTWSPHLNKNQLRNNIRQQVLKSGMLESGIDRIISQVVDPKINHTFRPQVEKAVHEFLATLNHKEEASGSTAPDDEKPDSSIVTQGVPAPGPSANVAKDAMSILETITSLNQEANAARASTEMSNAKTNERQSKKLSSQPSSDISTDKERTSEDLTDKEKATPDTGGEGVEAAPKSEEHSDVPCPVDEIKNSTKENSSSILLNKDVQQENGDQKNKSTDKGEKKSDISEKGERKKEKKEKTEKKFDYSKKSEDTQKLKDEKQAKEKEVESSKLPSEKNSNKANTVEGAREDCFLIDSDVDGLTDITVSSVHTSDLSSFEEDTEEEVVMSDSMEEGEITSDDEEKNKQNKTKTQTSDSNEGKPKSVRHAYVHKPYLYSKYYSDSDDELTVEQRRQSIAKEKEERLLRRQINREKLEEKRKQKAEKTKSSKAKSQGKSPADLEESSAKSLEPKAPRIKEVLKERKVLEKKVALSKKRRKNSRNVEENSKKKQQSEEDSKETLKTNEHCEKEKASSSKEPKHAYAKSEPSKPARRLSESLHSADENKNESKIEREHKRRTSTPVVMEGASEETDTRDGKRQVERSEIAMEESQKQKSTLKNEKHLKKDDSETPHLKSLPKKDMKSSKEKPEKEKTLSEEKSSTKHKYKGDSMHKTSDETELHSSEKSLKVEENTQKQSQQIKLSSDDKAERKSKHRNERKLSVLGKDGKPVSEYIIKTDENVRKDNNKKERHLSTEKTKAEHKSRRSSDSKIQKESLGSKQHGITLQRRSESCSEDKCDTDMTNLDSSVKPEEVVHKERRRTKNLLEEKLVLKSKSKGQGKQLKIAETELQENITKQMTTPKPDKEKNTEENDSEKQRKSKVEEKPVEETGVEPVSESAAASAHSSQRDPSHRAKLPLAKEKPKGERDTSSSRLDRKLSDGHKSKSLKHGSKDMKKREENKSDDKDGKEVDSNHEKARGNGSVLEKKLSRRLCENRRGSLSQEMTKGEEKSAANTLGTPSSSSLPRPKKCGDTTSIPEQEPMEIDSEAVVENVSEVSKTQDSSNSSSQQDIDSENGTKQKTTTTVLKDELRTSIVDSKPAGTACKSGRGTGVTSNAEKHADHKSTLTKKMHIQSAISKPNPGEKELTRGTHEVNVDSKTSQKMFPSVPSENERPQKNLKSTARPTEECVAQGDAVFEHSTDLDSSLSSSSMTVKPQKESLVSAVIPIVDRAGLEGSIASTSLVDRSDIPNQSLTIRKSEAPRVGDSKEGGKSSTVDTPAKANVASKRHIPEGYQATSLGSKQGRVNTSLSSKSSDMIVENENLRKESGLIHTTKQESDLSTQPSLKQDGIAVSLVADMSTGKDAKTVELKHNRVPDEIKTLPVDVERSEISEVDTSAGGNAASSVLQQRNGKPESVAARTRGAERASVATSTEEKDKGFTLNPVKAGDATTTSSETGECRMAFPCTSIEADEGFIVDADPRNNPLLGQVEASECTVFAAEGESGECSVAESEDRAAGPVAAHTVQSEASMNSVVTEEKDDAVTSAGSEEKCDGSSSRDPEIVEGTGTFISEIESDGAVTSAGTEIRMGSVSSEEIDGSQGNRTRMGPKKETEGTVTWADSAVTSTGITEEDGEGPASCMGSEDSSEGCAISSETEENGEVATGPCDDEGIVTSTGAKEEDDEGEGIVTSTGRGNEIGHASTCTGIGEESEGVLICESAEGDSQIGPTVEHVDAEAGAGIMNANESNVDSMSGAEKEIKDTEIYISISTGLVGGSQCNGLMASTAGDHISNQGSLAGGKSPGKGLMISTSTTNDYTPQVSTIVDMGEGHSSALKTEENLEGTRVNLEEFEAPMPSAVSGDESQLTARNCEEKDECAMISTSIREEFEMPISSATTIKCQPVAIVEEGDFEFPMPSAPTEVECPLASTSKEDKDECALISTSIAEECEASISGVSENARSVTDGSAIISTSSVEDCEGPVSSAIPQEKIRPLITPVEESSDTAMISTSTSEGWEAVMIGAVPPDEDQATIARVEDSGDAAVISTSTAECVLIVTSLDRPKESQLAASKPEGNDDLPATKVSRGEIPMPSKEAGPLLAVSTQEGHNGLSICEPAKEQDQPKAMATEEEDRLDKDCPVQGSFSARGQNESTLHLINVEEKKVLLSSIQREDRSPETETMGGSSTASCSPAERGVEKSANSSVHPRGPQQTAGDISVSICSLSAVNTGAKKADDMLPVKDTAPEYSSNPPDQQGRKDNLKTTTTKCITDLGSKIASSHSGSLPAAWHVAQSSAPTCEKDLTTKSDRNSKRAVEASAEKTGRGNGTRRSLQGEGNFEDTVSVEPNMCDIDNEESPPKVLGGSELATNLKTEEPTLMNESLNVSFDFNGGSYSILFESEEQIPSGGVVCAFFEDLGGHLVEEEERHIPKRKRKKHYASSEDELDDNSDVLDSRIETAQRQCSGAEPQDTKEENSGDLEELSRTSFKTNSSTPAFSADELSSSEATSEKTEQNEDDSIKSQEEDQPIIIKRKRGRPRKYPVETALKTSRYLEYFPFFKDESNKETANLQERGISNDDGDEKTVASARRRGRKPKRSLTLSDDAEFSEPERKRQKSVSEAAEDKKDQESDEEEEEEEEDEPPGATTRSTTRSEAQRSKTQLSPSTKRKREVSPPGARTRGQQRVEEAPVKKAKR